MTFHPTMRFEEILERNKRFAAQREVRALPPPSAASLLVVSCFDPRLLGLMEAALGLEDASASASVLWFKTAGAFVARDSATSRALLVKIFLFQVPAVLVVGHSSCRMAAFDSESFIRSFRDRGVKREAFGTMDLREWAGAIPSPRRGVQQTVANLRSDPACPPDLSVHGAVLDDTTGLLQPVPTDDAGALSKKDATSEMDPAGAQGASRAAEAASVPLRPDSAGSAVEAMARVLRSSPKWRYEVGRLRKEIARADNPASKLRLLEEFVERVGGDSREVVDAYERFVQTAQSQRDDPAAPTGILLRQLEQLVAKL